MSARSSPRTCSAPACSRRSIPPPIIEKISTIDTLPRFADWRQINAQALVTGRVTQADGRLKAEFRLWDVFAGQQLRGEQYNTTADNWRRISHIISDAIYERITGEKGLFRQPHRVRRRIRPEGAPHQAARADGSGRRQCALSHARRRSRAHAALLVGRRHHHLHVLWPGRSQSLSHEHRDRTARDRQQLSRHELQPALLARRPARDLQPAARRQFQSVRDGLALEGHDPLDRHAGDRHRALLFARRHAHQLRVGPRRKAADLRHGRRTAARRSASASATAPIRRRYGRRAATTSPSPSRRRAGSPSAS